MSAFLILLFAGNINQEKDVKEQFNIVSEIYAGEGEQGAYDQAFGDLRKKNKTTLTAEVENSGTLSLERTFGGNIGNYRIYGNSVQDGIPSPETPVEIQSVGDKTKNLFNLNDPSAIEAFCEMQIDKNSVILKPTEETNSRIVYKLSLKKNTNYTVSGSFQMINSEQFRGESSIMIRTSSGSSSDTTVAYKFLEKSDSSNQTINFTFNSGEYETLYIWLYFQMRNDGVQKNGNSYGIYKNIQIEEGETATAYEPYGYKIPVKVSGKNLFDIDSAVNENLVKNDDGTYTIWKNKENNDGRLAKRISVNIPANTTITVSVETVDYNGTYSLPFQIVCYPKGGGEQYIQFGLNTKHKTYSFSEEIIGMTIYQESKMPDGTYTTFKNLQIELGDTATSYEPYHAPVTTNIYLNEPLRKVGEYADYIDFKTGKVVRPVKEKIFTGEEGKRSTIEDGKGWTAWGSSTATSNSIGVWYCDTKGELGENKKAHFVYDRGLCSHFIHNILAKVYEATDDYIGYCRFDSGANPPYFGFRVPYTTLDDWLEFLKSEYSAGHPVRVHYVLRTPTEEIINLPELTAFEDYSKIEVLTQIAPSKIEAEYEGYTIE